MRTFDCVNSAPNGQKTNAIGPVLFEIPSFEILPGFYVSTNEFCTEFLRVFALIGVFNHFMININAYWVLFSVFYAILCVLIAYIGGLISYAVVFC